MIMSNRFWPMCPRLHHGVMMEDNLHNGPSGREWVCRKCGTRLYGNIQGAAAPAQINPEKPARVVVGDRPGPPRPPFKQRCGCWSNEKHVHRKAA